MGGYVAVRFTPKGNEEMMLDWMFANRMEDGKTAYPRCLYVLKQAEIVFYEGDFNGRILFKYRLEDCSVIYFKESFNTLLGMETSVVFSAAIQYYKDTFYIKSWRENWKPPQPYQTSVEEFKDTSPKFTGYYLENTKGERIKQERLNINQKVYLVIETNNAEGETATINLNNNNLDFEYNGKVLDNDILKGIKVLGNITKIKMGKTTGIISFDSGRGNTIEIALIEVLKPFRIDLEANNTDRKDGVFGFDTIPKKRIVEKNYDKLKQEYKPLTQKILGEEYIPSWLSIRKEQTVELELDWSKKRRAKDYTTISFEEHKDFTFEPKNLKDAKTVKITCNNTSETSAQILIKANSELVVGALNIFYKKPKNIDLEWCFVETQGNNIDYEKLKKGIKKEDLKKHIKNGLNPALIDINISNNNPQIVDLSVYTERLKQRGIIASNDLVGSYIVNSKKNNFIGAISMKHNESVNKLNLYFINLKCVNPNNIKEEGGFDLIGGFSPIGTGKAYVVLDDNNDIIPENIVHELMHGLGLRHTFEGTYNYKDYKTDNYMDYKNNKRHTYKWQWEKLHEYEKLK